MGSLDTLRKERSRFRKLEESYHTELDIQPREVNESVDAIENTYSALPYDDKSGGFTSIQPTSKDISYGDKIESISSPIHLIHFPLLGICLKPYRNLERI